MTKVEIYTKITKAYSNYMQNHIKIYIKYSYFVNVTGDKAGDYHRPNTQKRKFTAKELPKTHKILCINDTISSETIKIGLVKFHEVSAFWVKKLVRDKVLTCPFYLFQAVPTNYYKYEYALRPKLVYDLRNVPAFSFVLNTTEDDAIILK